MEWDVLTVALTWLVVAMTGMSAAAMIAVLGRKGWSRGLAGIFMLLVLVALAAVLRLVAGPQPDGTTLLLACVLLSMAFNGLVVGLHRFRQIDVDWRKLAIAPAAVLVLGSWPVLGGEHGIALLHAVATVFLAQGAWAAFSLWHMRRLELGLGYRMVCAAVGIVLVGLPVFQCALGLGLVANASEAHLPLYGLRALLMVATLLLLSLGFMRMVQDRREARSRHAALRDPLTRMLNRRALVSALKHCMRSAARQERPLALLLVDVDHFKRVNDTYGHISGDKVLRHISRVLASHVRADAFVGRFGGEEFVIVCPDTAMDDAEILAKRLNLAVRAYSVPLKGQSLQVTVSIGGYAGIVPDNTPWENLLEAADSAMYRAKDAGRDRVVMQRDLPQVSTLGQASRRQPSHA